MIQATADIKRPARRFMPEDFQVTTWEALEPFFKDLATRTIHSKEELETWLKDSSELEAVVSEDACWRQVRMTCDTENKALTEAFNFFYTDIQPHIQPYADKINRKLIDCPFTKGLDQDKFFTYLRSVKKSIELFREENIPLFSELSVMQQQYGAVAGKMTVEVGGKEYTLQQASKFLESHDRALRESVYRKVNERRLQDKDILNDLFTQLIHKRHQVALNAGFDNYRDYIFVDKGRFDYTKEDCFDFHEGVKKYVLPLVDLINRRRKSKLGLDPLRPWDTEAEPEGVKPLAPFTDGKELLEKSMICFNRLRPFFADCLRKMNELHHLDLDSRKGKAPGGYNMPLAESGAP
ncbi:MAG TPA: M3 family metallopeptidase, partial [Agriterribacter sp.]|nr:M3 family metallopeptidase [Agriterribacter sp.]